MGCLFTKVKEPIDGIYLDVHELKEVPVLQEQPASSLKKRRKTSQSLDIVPSSCLDSQQQSIQKPEPTILRTEFPSFDEIVPPQILASPDPEIIANKSILNDEDNVSELEALPRRAFSENISNGCRGKKTSENRSGDAEKLTRKCSFGIETKIIEFNPKKCINIYRLDSGSIRDEEDDLSFYEVSYEDDDQDPSYTEVNDNSSVYLNESLAFQNANFDDSHVENTKTNEGSALNSTFPKSYKTQQTASVYSTVSHQAYSGAKRAISNRKTPGSIWDNHVQQLAGTSITQQQHRVMQSTEGANASDHVRHAAHSYSKGRQNSMDRNAAIEHQHLNSDEPPVVYHTKRRISTISISSNDKEELNALDGVTHLHPHPNSSSDRRNSTTFDNSVRRLSSNLVGFFHS